MLIYSIYIIGFDCMSYNEEVFKRKLLNNEAIEDNSCWVYSDVYYGQSEDMSYEMYIKQNCNSVFGIRNIVFLFYNTLKKRYHNNFYLDFKDMDNKVVFILRGQPVFSDSYLNLIVKYVISFVPGNCNVSCYFVLPGDPDYMLDKNLTVNFSEKSSKGLFGKLKKITSNDDNSVDVKNLLDSISLQNYIAHINNSSKPDINNQNTNNNIQDRSVSGANANSFVDNRRHVDLSDDANTQDTSNIPQSGKSDISQRPEPKVDEKEIIDDWSGQSNTDYLIYCTECGKENYPLNTNCTECNNPLLTYRIDYGNEFKSFDEIINEDSLKILENAQIPLEFYDYVKETVLNKCEKIDFSEDVNVYDKILRICRHYVNIIPNDQIEHNGEYNFNSIVFNPTLSRSQQCATLIKYLAVDIHIEIMEYLFMYIFDVKNNVYVKSFINFMRNSLDETVIEKYYQAKVESNYIPEKYHNYEDVDRLYLDCLVYNKYLDEERFQTLLVIGNSYAQEIISILDKVITEYIQNDLAEEFVYDNEQEGSDLRNYQLDTVINTGDILKNYVEGMRNLLKFLIDTPEAREELDKMKEVFGNVNNS